MQMKDTVGGISNDGLFMTWHFHNRRLCEALMQAQAAPFSGLPLIEAVRVWLGGGTLAGQILGGR